MRKSTDSASSAARSYKFLAPAPYAGVVQRDGILQRVAEHSTARVFLLQGPAGHGKSTALQQIKDAAESNGELTGWLTFDAGDNDPRRFFMQFESLVAALRSRAGGAATADIESPGLKLRYRSDWLIHSFARIGRPVALFFDEFQSLHDKAILSFFKTLLESAPDGLRIFLGSRSLPDVGLARLIVNNRALILRGDDLRFTPQEVERFFAAAGDLGIDHDEIDAIYQRTEGWPAALQLFRLTLRSPTVRKSLGNENARAPRELAEYLAENVLTLQPPRIQEFLLRTSQLTRLSAPLCDAVLGRTDSWDVLLQLERSGMFLRCVDPQDGWFKYHTLFSSILAEQLRAQSPGAASEVHHRAAHWYMQHEFFEEAVLHATTCGEHELAADALNRWSSYLVASGHLRTVEFWSERIPFGYISARTDLTIKCAYAVVFLRRQQRARPLLDLLRQRPERGSVLDTTDPRVVLSMAFIRDDDIPAADSISREVSLMQPDAQGFAAFELGALANLRGFCALTTQELESAREYLAQARVYNEHVDAPFSRGYTLAVSAALQMVQGSLREALERFREGLGKQRVATDKSLASAVAFSCYVWGLYEANDLETAESIFAQNHDIISDSTRTDFLTVAFLSMARAHDALGRCPKADALLDEAETIGRENNWTRLISTVQWERVRRALLRGAAEQAFAAAATARATPNMPASWIPFGSDVECQEFGEIRLALARHDFNEAKVRILDEFKRQHGRVLRQIKLYLLQSVHGVRSNDKAAAHHSLCAALRLAQAGGFVRCILDEGEEVLALLREQSRSLLDGPQRPGAKRDLDFIETLLQASGTEVQRASTATATTLQPLTDREREMLVLLSNGVSNKGMANRLFISENTVKFHLKNIYAKLAVTSRVQAVTAARRIGIVR